VLDIIVLDLFVKLPIGVSVLLFILPDWFEVIFCPNIVPTVVPTDINTKNIDIVIRRLFIIL
jgi:hypothetical protein